MKKSLKGFEGGLEAAYSYLLLFYIFVQMSWHKTFEALSKYCSQYRFCSYCPWQISGIWASTFGTCHVPMDKYSDVEKVV